MSHRTQTTVSHWIDLTDAEVFTAPTYTAGSVVRIRRLVVEVVDGSVSTVTGVGRRVLRSGKDGNVGTTMSVWAGHSLRPLVDEILAAHGVEVVL